MKKEKSLTFRMTIKEFQKLRELSKNANESVSSFLRKIIIDSEKKYGKQYD